MSGASGRRGTGSRPYRRNRDRVLARSDLCGLCGHSGATTADHIIVAKLWPRDATGNMLPGFDAEANLQPAHGTMGVIAVNPCPTCGKLCNQVKGDRVGPDDEPTPEPSSRRWLSQ